MSAKTGNSRSWKKYAYEMISIVLGVLVALAVDEWNEDRENSQRAQVALLNIQNEMHKNLEILEYLHPGNLEAYSVIINDTSESDSAQILPGLQLQEVAWKTFMSNGISVHVDYDELYQVAEVYSIQNIYKNFGNTFIQQIMNTRSLSIVNGNPLTDSEIIISSVELLALLISIEEQLLDHLRAYLDESPGEDSA